MPPCGPGITLRQEYEYLVNSIIRLRSILLGTEILDENTYTDDLIQKNLTELLFEIEKVILDMKDINGIRREYRRRYTELRCHLMNVRRCRVAQHNQELQAHDDGEIKVNHELQSRLNFFDDLLFTL
nr:hypothetical protein 003-36 [Oikopleura dioica]